MSEILQFFLAEQSIYYSTNHSITRNNSIHRIFESKKRKNLKITLQITYSGLFIFVKYKFVKDIFNNAAVRPSADSVDKSYYDKNSRYVRH